MSLPTRVAALAAFSLALASPLAHAIGVNDATGDFVAGYTGSHLGDLDVVGSFVTYNASTDTFVFAGTMNGDIGLSPSGFYVWGVDRGAGMAEFAPNGLPNILFDAVVVFNQDGSGRVVDLGTGTPTDLPAGTAQVVGSTIIGAVSGSMLASTGFDKTAYTWNLWPRDGTLPMGFAQISDFAPDTDNAPVLVVGTAPVPEPSTLALLGLGIASLVGWRKRRA